MIEKKFIEIKMAKIKKIKPLFLYDKKSKPVMVELSIKEFTYFSEVLKTFSENAKKKRRD